MSGTCEAAMELRSKAPAHVEGLWLWVQGDNGTVAQSTGIWIIVPLVTVCKVLEATKSHEWEHRNAESHSGFRLWVGPSLLRCWLWYLKQRQAQGRHSAYTVLGSGV